MDNYKNVPQFLYGLSPSQMEMFMADDNPYNRKSTKVTEESVASSRSYSMSALQVTTWVWAMPSMSMGRAGRGYRRMRSSTPDLPSLLLDSRIIFLGMPDENNELVASETDAYAIADFITLHFLKSFWETRSPSEKAAMPTTTTSLFFFADSTIWSAHFMSVSTFSSPCTRSFQLMHAANAFFSPSVFARLAAAIVAALAPSSSRRRLTLSARLSGAATAALGLLAPLAASGAGAGFSGGDAAAS